MLSELLAQGAFEMSSLFVCICSRGNSFGSLLMVQIIHSVILNYV